jgi:hypothetical protein
MSAPETLGDTIETSADRADEIAADVADTVHEPVVEVVPASERSSGGPTPFVVVGVAFALGVVLAKVIGRRARAGG